MKMILAHMGETGPEETEEYLIGTEILLDTALCAGGISRRSSSRG